MSIVTLRPNGNDGSGGFWYAEPGEYYDHTGGDIWSKLRDNNDGSYYYGLTYNSWAHLRFDDYNLAANERCWHFRGIIRVRASSDAPYNTVDSDWWMKPMYMGDQGGGNFRGAMDSVNFANYYSGWIGYDLNSSQINGLEMGIRENWNAYGTDWSEAYIELEILHQPVAGAVGPNNTQTTRSPTVTWAYSDPDGRIGQRSWRVHIRRADTTELIYDSGEVFDAAQSHALPVALGNGAYQVIVQVSNANFTAWYSNWTYASPNMTVNAAPATPTGLARTGTNDDNSPNFSANLTGYSGYGVQTKARFEVWNADASFLPTTLVGSVDSSYVTAGGAVTAEYVSSLPVGRYVVRVKAMESTGQESGWSSYVSFQVTQIANLDRSLLWNVATPTVQVPKDLTLRYNVIENKAKQLSLSWNAFQAATKDLTLVWNDATAWGRVTENTDIWTRVIE